MMTTPRIRLITFVVFLAGVTACTEAPPEPGASDSPQPTTSASSEPSPPTSSPTIEIPPVDGPYDWTTDPADFVVGVDNPYFPLEPGTVLVYEGQSHGEREVVTIHVTDRTREILGVTCVVVRDTVTVAGEIH